MIVKHHASLCIWTESVWHPIQKSLDATSDIWSLRPVTRPSPERGVAISYPQRMIDATDKAYAVKGWSLKLDPLEGLQIQP